VSRSAPIGIRFVPVNLVRRQAQREVAQLLYGPCIWFEQPHVGINAADLHTAAIRRKRRREGHLRCARRGVNRLPSATVHICHTRAADATSTREPSALSAPDSP
jgi:hypothetical protein